MIENCSNFNNADLSSRQIQTYFLYNLLHLEVFVCVVLLNVHHESFLFFNRLSVFYQLDFLEQLQLPQQQVTHKIFLKILLLAFLGSYLRFQDLKTRFLNFNELFESHGGFLHFIFHLILNNLIWSSWEQKLVISDSVLSWSLPKFKVNLLITQPNFSKNITFPFNSLIFHLAQWFFNIQNFIDFVRQFDSIAHHKFIEYFSSGGFIALHLIKQCIVILKNR